MKGPPRIWRFRRMLIFGLALLFLAPVDGTALLFALQDKKDEPAEEREKDRPAGVVLPPAANNAPGPRPGMSHSPAPTGNGAPDLPATSNRPGLRTSRTALPGGPGPGPVVG